MPTPRSPFILPLVLFACIERPLGETDGSTAGPSTGDAPPAPGTNTDAPGTATLPTTGAPPQPTTATTVDPSGTTAIDPGTATFDPQQKFDILPPKPASGLSGCTLDGPAGTMVSGSSSLGPFMAQRAYFGYSGSLDETYTPVLLFVSPEADPALEVVTQNGTSGAVLYAYVHSDPFAEGGWIGTWPLSAHVYDAPDAGELARPDAIVFDARAGNWDEHDPLDPPRLVGSLQGAIAGPFDAVFCDKLSDMIINE